MVHKKILTMFPMGWTPMIAVHQLDFTKEDAYYFLWIMNRLYFSFYNYNTKDKEDLSKVSSYMLFGRVEKRRIPFESKFNYPSQIMSLILPLSTDIYVNDMLKANLLESVALFQGVILDKSVFCPLDKQSTVGYLVELMELTPMENRMGYPDRLSDKIPTNISTSHIHEENWVRDVERLTTLGVTKITIIPRLLYNHVEKMMTKRKSGHNDLFLQRVFEQIGQTLSNPIEIGYDQDDPQLTSEKPTKLPDCDKPLDEQSDEQIQQFIERVNTSAVESADLNRVQELEAKVKALERSLKVCETGREGCLMEMERETSRLNKRIRELEENLQLATENSVNHQACICSGECLSDGKRNDNSKPKQPVEDLYKKSELIACLNLASKKSPQIYSSFWSTNPNTELLSNLLESKFSKDDILKAMSNMSLISEKCTKVYTEHMIRVALETGIGSSKDIKKMLQIPEDHSFQDMITSLFNAGTVDPSVPEKIREIHLMVKNLSTLKISEASGVQAFSSQKQAPVIPQPLLANLKKMSEQSPSSKNESLGTQSDTGTTSKKRTITMMKDGKLIRVEVD